MRPVGGPGSFRTRSMRYSRVRSLCQASGLQQAGRRFSFSFGRDRLRVARAAIRLFYGNFWLESGLASKPVPRREAMGVKGFWICTLPKIPSSHSAFHWKGFALLSPQ